MRTAYFDSGDPEMYFDNPNLHWGDPAYLLEPGDPGYVPPALPVTETKKKTKKMKHNRYYPVRVADQIIWLTNFADKLPAYATALGLAPATVTALQAECRWLIYVLQNWLNEVRAFSLACTQTSNAAQTGSGTDPVALNSFTAPALPATVTPKTPGSLTRLFTAVQDIKNGHKLTDAIASDLGVVGSADSGPDLTAVQPVITAAVSGGKVELGWGWQGNVAWLDSCEIVVDRADGKSFVPLVVDTTPNYTDTQTFPTAKAIWTYKAIYRVGDGQVGQWSQPVSVTVGG